MADARQKHNWDQTSLIWSTLANANRDHKKTRKPFLPSMVHPYREDSEYEQSDGHTLDDFRMVIEGMSSNGRKKH